MWRDFEIFFLFATDFSSFIFTFLSFSIRSNSLMIVKELMSTKRIKRMHYPKRDVVKCQISFRFYGKLKQLHKRFDGFRLSHSTMSIMFYRDQFYLKTLLILSNIILEPVECESQSKQNNFNQLFHGFHKTETSGLSLPEIL